jgi:hypothetical protein
MNLAPPTPAAVETALGHGFMITQSQTCIAKLRAWHVRAKTAASLCFISFYHFGFGNRSESRRLVVEKKYTRM